jgi:hypothetical protein
VQNEIGVDKLQG